MGEGFVGCLELCVDHANSELELKPLSRDIFQGVLIVSGFVVLSLREPPCLYEGHIGSCRQTMLPITRTCGLYNTLRRAFVQVCRILSWDEMLTKLHIHGTAHGNIKIALHHPIPWRQHWVASPSHCQPDDTEQVNRTTTQRLT